MVTDWARRLAFSALAVVPRQAWRKNDLAKVAVHRHSKVVRAENPIAVRPFLLKVVEYKWQLIKTSTAKYGVVQQTPCNNGLFNTMLSRSACV